MKTVIAYCCFRKWKKIYLFEIFLFNEIIKFPHWYITFVTFRCSKRSSILLLAYVSAVSFSSFLVMDLFGTV